MDLPLLFFLVILAWVLQEAFGGGGSTPPGDAKGDGDSPRKKR